MASSEKVFEALQGSIQSKISASEESKKEVESKIKLNLGKLKKFGQKESKTPTGLNSSHDENAQQDTSGTSNSNPSFGMKRERLILK